MLSLDFSILTITLAAATAVLVVVLLLLILPPLRRVSRAVKADTAAAQALIEGGGAQVEYAPVSIIIHAQSDATPLATLIEMIMAQDYPAPFEVVVVNDGNDDGVNNVVSRLENDYRNLYMTYLAPDSRNLSRRKLSITLGIKAVRYPNVIILWGNARLVSAYWLRLMMHRMAMGNDIVTGYGYAIPSPQAQDGMKKRRLMAFDTVRTSVQYLSSALNGRLYRAFGSNLGYHTDLFFDRKGFSGSLNLRYGDDDIFVSSIARGRHFGVELSEQAMVQTVEDSPEQMHRLDKLRHDFTARYVSRRQRVRWGTASLLWWLWTAASVVTIVSGLPSLIPAAAVTLLSLLLCVPVMMAWRRTSIALHSRKLCLTVPFMMWIYPFYTAVYRIMGRRHRKSNYTWSTAKN